MSDFTDVLDGVAGRLVVGTDGSSHAEAAVDWAGRHAVDSGLGLTIVAVGAPVVASSPEVAAYVYADAPLDSAKEIAQADVTRMREAHPELDVAGVAVVGSPVEVLGEMTSRAHAVVTGSRGLRGIRGALAGSVSNALAGRSTGPVIVVHTPGDEHADGPVVLGLDGGEGAGKAARFAFDEARRLGTGVVAVTAWSPVLEELLPTPVDDDDSARQLTQMIEGELAGLREEFADVPVETRIVREGALDALVDASRTAAMVVVSPRTRGLLASLIEGSTSRDLMQKAQCPAAVVRAG